MIVLVSIFPEQIVMAQISRSYLRIVQNQKMLGPCPLKLEIHLVTIARQQVVKRFKNKKNDG
jgi:hypothetical protein